MTAELKFRLLPRVSCSGSMGCELGATASTSRTLMSLGKISKRRINNSFFGDLPEQSRKLVCLPVAKNLINSLVERRGK